MEENYLVSLIVLSFCYALVFFKKEPKNSLEQEANKYATETKDTSLSGVDKYLQEKQDVVLQNEGSGVAKYLANKEQSSTVSSVSKYVSQQAIQTKLRAKENVSSVEKYLNNRG